MICTTTTCCFLLLLFFHHRVNCVPAECTGLPDTSDIEGRLQVQLDNAGGGDPSASGSSTVFLHKFYPACTAQGSYSGTYREYSVVVKYTTDVAMNVIRLFNLECQELIAGQMSWEAAGLSQVDSGYQFMTIEPRSNCSGCSASAGNDFNCEACDPACNGGLMRCTGTGSNDCCAAFEVDGICIPTTTCSETNFVANEQNNFTCACGLTDCSDGYVFNSTLCSCVVSDICVADNPCTNGVCELVNSPDNFTCDCTGTNYMGTNCSECDLSCINGYTADSMCAKCILDDICEAESPCKNGGTCILGETPDQFSCSCLDNFDEATNCSSIPNMNLQVNSCPNQHSLECKRMRVEVICNSLTRRGVDLPQRCDRGY